MAPQQPLTDLTIHLNNPPDITFRREELFHLRNGTIRLSPPEFDRYWPYMTNAWHKHSTHAKPATAQRPTESRIFWCRNGRADGRGNNSTSRGLRRRIAEDRPQCPVKMCIQVHFAVGPDGSIGDPVLYEIYKKSGGEHRETLSSIDSKRRNEKVIEACTAHLLENAGNPTHFIAKTWKDDPSFKNALEQAGGAEVGPDDAQNYVRQAHLSRMKKGQPKRDSVGKSTATTSAGGTKLLDPEVLAGVKSFQAAMPSAAKNRPATADVVVRRQYLDAAYAYFASILPPLPSQHHDLANTMPVMTREQDLTFTSSWGGLYRMIKYLEPATSIARPSSCIMYFYPGYPLSSSVVTRLPIMRQLVQRTNLPVLALNYGTAPEFTPTLLHPATGQPIPGAVQDAFDALQYLRGHAQELGIDSSRIVAYGEGGGGAIAAALCHFASKRGGGIAKCVLGSPMLDDRPGSIDPPTVSAPSNNLNATSVNGTSNANMDSSTSTAPAAALPTTRAKTSKLSPSLQLWTHEDDNTAWTALLKPCTILTPMPNMPAPMPSQIAITSELIPGRMSEATKGLPPTYIDVGELDILREECIEYAKKLWLGGVSCELSVLPNVGTWFMEVAPSAAIARRCMDGRIRALTSV